MDKRTIFVITLRGEGELRNHTRHLSEDVKRALILVDDESTVEELMKKAAPSLRKNLSEMLQELADGWFIQDKSKAGQAPRVAVPRQPEDDAGDELDFTSVARSDAVPRAAKPANVTELEVGHQTIRLKKGGVASTARGQEAAEIKSQLDEARARLETEARTHAEEEAKIRRETEAARFKATQEMAKAKAQLQAAQTRMVEEAKVRAELEAKAKQEAEAVRRKAEQEAAEAKAHFKAAQEKIAAEAKVRAEAEAEARKELEQARLKAEQEAAEVKAQLEAAQQRIAAEAKARDEVEARVRDGATAVQLKAEQESAEAKALAEIGAKARREAEEARLKAEREAAEAKAQLEAVQARMEEEARARVEAEERVRQEAEAARIRAEQEAAEAKAQLEAIQARMEAEARARTELEEKTRQETEAERLKTEQEAAAAKAQLEAVQSRIEEEARVRTEAEANARKELEEARLKAEQEAAEIRAQLEAAQARLEEEARARIEAEARVKQEAEAALQKAEQEAAEARAQLEAVQASVEKEAGARADSEARVKQEAEAALQKAEQEAAEARVQLEAAQARLEEEILAKQEAEAIRAEAEQEAARLRSEAEAMMLKAEQEANEARAQLEAVQLSMETQARERTAAEEQARRQAEAVHRQAEQEAAEAKAQLVAAQAKLEEETRARVETETRTRQEVEAARLAAEQAAEEAKAQLEAAQARIEEEARVRAEAEIRQKHEAEVAQRQAEEEAARLRKEAEAILIKAEREAAEARAKFEATMLKLGSGSKLPTETTSPNRDPGATQRMLAFSETGLFSALGSVEGGAAKPGKTASSTRSMVASVLFLDIVGYTKRAVSKQIELKNEFNNLVSGLLANVEEGKRIILDTGDGAAIGFLQHPELAIEVAMQLRQILTTNRHQDYPELQVRMGINLGPVNVLMDMNQQNNMVGDGINDAQRIMSFAKPDLIYISRSYYDVISRLSGDYSNWLVYRGLEKDKHGRQHQIYEVTDGLVASGEIQRMPGPDSFRLGPITLGGINDSLELSTGLASSQDIEEAQLDAKAEELEDQRTQQLPEFVVVPSEEEVIPPAAKEAEIAEVSPISDEERREDEARLQEHLRKMTEEQDKAWKKAEKRARDMAVTQALAPDERGTKPQEETSQGRTAARKIRRPLPWNKILAGFLLFILLLVFVLPYVWPMQKYIHQLEQKLSEQLRQPIHISGMEAALLPLPTLQLKGISVGDGGELKAAEAIVHFSLSAVFGKAKSISSVELRELEIGASSFADSLATLQSINGDIRYPVAGLELVNAHIAIPELNLPAVSGLVDFSGQDQVNSVTLNSADQNFTVSYNPGAAQEQLSLRLQRSSLPMFPNARIDDLQLTGKVGGDAIDFSDVYAQMYGGELKGSMKLSWRDAWQLSGQVRASRMGLGALFPDLGLDGDFGGNGDIVLRSAKLDQLAGSLRLDGQFETGKTVVNRLDILGESRSQGAGGVTGRTYLEGLKGSLHYDRNGLSLNQMQLLSEVFNGNGAIRVGRDGQLSGQLNIALKVRPERYTLTLSGTPATPRIRTPN